MHNKIVELGKLKEIIIELKHQGKRIISTSGCFDILHAGHVTYLEEAKAKGDILIIFLNSDNSVRKIKGDERPIVPQEERAIVIAGLGCVDYVCIFDEETPCGVIEKVQPDVVIKGGDYRGKHIPEMDVVTNYGGKVEYVSLVEGRSSTNIIEKIKSLCSKEENSGVISKENNTTVTKKKYT